MRSYLKVHLLILFLITAVVYFNSVSGQFVFDDKPMITTYDLVQDIGNLPKVFVSPTSLYGNTNYYRPLQTASNMFDYFLWGKEPAGFHITNILLHIMVVFLVYIMTYKLFKDGTAAFISGAVFSVHPVNSSVVAYISGRADSLLSIFFLAGFIAYLNYITGNKRKLFYVFSLVCFTFSLLSKELGMIFPFMIVLFSEYLHKYTAIKYEKPSRAAYIPYFTVLCVYLLFRFSYMDFSAKNAASSLPFINRLLTAPCLIIQYVRTVFLPYDLHMGRMLWAVFSPLEPRFIFSVVLLTGFIFIGFRYRNKYKGFWFGICWFLVMILPSLNIITPLFYTMAENWVYLPGIGIYICVALGISSILTYLKSRNMTVLKYCVLLLCFLYAAALGLVAYGYNETWKNEISLGRNTLKFNPMEFKVCNNVGVSYMSIGDYDKAEEYFLRCLEIKPDTGMAYFNLFRLYMAKQDPDKAYEFLKKARDLDPQRVDLVIEKMGLKINNPDR